MKKTIKITDINITDDGVSFVILIMHGSILLSKSPEFYIKFDRKVKIYNSTIIDIFKFILKSQSNRNIAKYYDVKIDLAEDVDIMEQRKKYVNYIVFDSLGLDCNAINLIFDKTIDYTSINLKNIKLQDQTSLAVSHIPCIKVDMKFPQMIDNVVKFNIGHSRNFEIAAMFLIDDLEARMMFTGSVRDSQSTYKFGSDFNVCNSNFINGSLAAMIINLALDRENFWNRLIKCGGKFPRFKDFAKLMMAIYADKYLKLGYMTDEKIESYIEENDIQLTRDQTVSVFYEDDFNKKRSSASDLIIPLLNIEKQYICKFFKKTEDQTQLDKLYSFLADDRFTSIVEACQSEFKLFNKEKLEKVLFDDKKSFDAISNKIDMIENQIKEITSK